MSGPGIGGACFSHRGKERDELHGTQQFDYDRTFEEDVVFSNPQGEA